MHLDKQRIKIRGNIMNRFSFDEQSFGEYETILLKDNSTGSKIEIALKGSTLLNYFIPFNNSHLNIIDGSRNPEEFVASRSARSWIMAPFANRIPFGKYYFNGKNYQLKPTIFGNEVMHGFVACEKFKVKDVNTTAEFIEVTLHCEIRPGKYEGYPFCINILVSFRLEENKLSIKITCENIDEKPVPFGCGWHPYFKTSDKGIEKLILTLNAKGTILLDERNIPLEGENAYADIINFPLYDFRSKINESTRIIGNRKLDNCYSNLIKEKDGFSRSSITDPSNGLEIAMFQKGGVALVYTGDTLKHRQRESIALEPMQFLTNAFNRKELESKIKVEPGEKSEFLFGVEYNYD